MGKRGRRYRAAVNSRSNSAQGNRLSRRWPRSLVFGVSAVLGASLLITAVALGPSRGASATYDSLGAPTAPSVAQPEASGFLIPSPGTAVDPLHGPSVPGIPIPTVPVIGPPSVVVP